MSDVVDQGRLVNSRADRFLVPASRPEAALSPSERIRVRFAGTGSGVEGLTWGQVGLWDAMRRQRSWLPIGAVSPLPPGTTGAELAEELRFMMSRYPSLRTRLRLDPDGARQVLSAAGEIPLEIFDVPDDAEPAEAADDVVRHYVDAGHDFAADWPIRMAAVRHRGGLTHRVVVMCHLATDGAGASVMTADLLTRSRPAEDRVGDDPGMPETTMDPLEQARWQRSPAGQRQNDKALRYCARVLRAVPARRFPPPAAKPQPRYWFASFSSPALYLAAHAIAVRTRSDSPTVLLALFAIGYGRATGIHPMMAMVLVNNRYQRGLARTVSPITNAVPCVIDPTSTTVDELVRATRGRSLTAYKYGYFDPLRFNALVAEVSQQRGEQVDTACYLNDRRMRYRGLPEGPVPHPAQVTAALPRTSFEWKQRQDREAYERFFLHIEDVPDTILISLFIDSHEVTPETAEACLRGMEEAAVAAL